MKKLLPFLAIFSWALASCVDDPLAHDNMPVVTLAEPADLKRTSVILEADLDGPDIGSVTEIGFILGENSSLNDNVVKVSVEEVAKGRFSALVKDLQIGHTYFYVAYATNGRQTVKSQVEALTTLTRSSALLGDIEVYEVGDETFLRSSIEDDGGATINMAGFCFDTNENPTIYKGNIQAKLEEDGSFTANVTEYLDEGKTYYLRAFVDNDILGDGTTSISYGLQTVYTMPKIEKVNIPDAVFKAYIVENFDKNGDKEISLKEAAAITEINVNTNDIATLKGVECFENLTRIVAIGSLSSSEGINPQGGLTELDLTSNHLLKFLRCDNNNLTKVSISPEAKLESVDFIYNLNLSSIGSFDKSELKYINLWGTAVEELDLREAANLETIHYNVGNLNIEGLADLKTVKLQSVDGKIDLSKCADLDYLYAEGCSLKGLDLSNHPELTHLTCRVCGLTEFDLSHVSELTTLDCGYNKITSGYLDISANRKLTRFNASGCEVHTIYVWEGFEEADYPDFNKDPIAHYVIKGQGYGGPSILSDIPDENFRAYVLENFDYDANGDVTADEVLEITRLTVNTDNISSLKGIEKFVNLKYLVANGTAPSDFHNEDHNGILEDLNLSNNTKLRYLECSSNRLLEKITFAKEARLEEIVLFANYKLLEFVDFNLASLKRLDFRHMPTVEMDLRTAINLEYLAISGSPYSKTYTVSDRNINIDGLTKITDLFFDYLNGSINISSLTELENLKVSHSRLTSLDLSNNTKLRSLNCQYNELKELDFHNCPNLESLCTSGYNTGISFDLSYCPELKSLRCWDNGLTSLDLSAVLKLEKLEAYDNPDLHTIYVWEGFNEADYPDFHKDASTRYVVKGQGYGGPSILSEIPDENFRAYVLENFDYDGNGDVTTDEALRVESIDLNTDNVYSLEGIRYFENLGSLVARGTEKYRGQLTELDLSYNQKLYNIWCGFNHIKYIKFHPDAIIEYLNIGYNQELTGFSEFDMSQLRYVALRETMVTDLDLRGAVNLDSIEYSYSPDPEIKRSLNIDGLTKITRMELRHLDGNLDVSNLSNLEYLCADYCNLKELDLRNLSKLKVLIVNGNQLTAIDLNGCIMLESLSIPYNLLGELDLQDNMKLTYMNSYGNPDLRTIYVWEGFNEADYPDFHKDASTRYVVKGQDYGSPSILSDIPDENFRAYVLENFDYDGNGDVTTEEALLVESIDLNTDNVYSLEGIKHFENLKYLTASGTEKYSGSNPGCLTELDLSGNVNLKLLYCLFNHIESIVFHPDTQPEVLNVGYNNELSYISSFDMSQLSVLKLRYTMIDELDLRTAANLRVLEYSYTHFTLTRTLNIEGLTKIEDLELEYLNGSLDVSLLSNLVRLSVRSSNLKELDLRNNKKLTYLSCSGNELDALDVSQLVELEDLECQRNNISVLDVSVNTKLSYLSAYDNPDLHTIYVWDGFNEADYPDFYKDETATYVVKQ